MSYPHAAVEELMNTAALPAKLDRVGTRFEQIESAAEVNRQLPRDLPLLLMRQDEFEIFVMARREGFEPPTLRFEA